jgi:hypothetical protein
MVRFAAGLLLTATMAAPAFAWAHADSRGGHAAASPARTTSSAPQLQAHAAPSHQTHFAPQPAIDHHYAPPPRPMPSAVMHHGYARPPLPVRPIINSYLAPYRPTYYAPRVVPAPGPYYFIAGSGYTGADLAYPAEPNWNWTPVESVAALAGNDIAGRSDVRYYCPDTREYYPVVASCASPWLKVIP